jgi:hypothetical protein
MLTVCHLYGKSGLSAVFTLPIINLIYTAGALTILDSLNTGISGSNPFMSVVHIYFFCVVLNCVGKKKN